MRRALVLALALASTATAGCGGKSATTTSTTTPPVISARPTTRVPIEEPEQEEGVQIINGRGRMDPAAIEVGLAPHTQALTDCYMTKVNRRRWLGGRVVIHWDISKAGEIIGVRLAESDLGAWPIEKCLLDVARAATFAKPVGGDADFSLPLEFSAKGRSITWDDDKGLRAVGGQAIKLDACAKGKVHAPANVTVTVYVGPAGKAQSVGFASASTLIDDAWAECAEKAALAWRLPDPRGQVAKLAFRYRTQ